jgi:hypothetical protein
MDIVDMNLLGRALLVAQKALEVCLQDTPDTLRDPYRNSSIQVVMSIIARTQEEMDLPTTPEGLGLPSFPDELRRQH